MLLTPTSDAYCMLFFIGNHLRKHTVSLLQTKYHQITCWTLPLLLLILRCFSSGTTYSARHLPVGPHEDLDLRDLCGIWKRPAGAGYGSGGCWTTRYWWSCLPEHGTQVPCMCWIRWSSHLAFLKVCPEEKHHTVSSSIGRVQHVMWWYFVCSGESVCFRTRVPMQNLTVLIPTTCLQSL